MCILARAPGGQMRGAATQAMPLSIVEERQRSRCPPAAAPLRAAVAGTPAALLAPYIPYPGYARRSRLAGVPGDRSKMYMLFLRRP